MIYRCLSVLDPCSHVQQTGNVCDACAKSAEDYVKNSRDEAIRNAISILRSHKYQITDPNGKKIT